MERFGGGFLHEAKSDRLEQAKARRRYWTRQLGRFQPLWRGSPIAKTHYKITLADILDAHERALTFGGLPGIRDLGAVQSAIARPYMGYYRKIEEKAAAIIESVAGGHCFTDGNKRTSLYLLNLLLRKSGYLLVPLPGEDINRSVEDMIVDFVEHRLSKAQVTGWLKLRIRRGKR